MNQPRLPVLFISHGSPMLVFEPGQTGPTLRAKGDQLRAQGGIRAVLVMSPHWMSAGVEVMSGAQPATWHDFGGFPEPLYRLQYPSAGAPELAQQVVELLQAAGIPAQADPARPYDHGAWMPLLHMLPQADLPVLQVSLPAYFEPAQLYAMGQALAGLREQGVLIVASGSMTHNLRELRRVQGPTEPYVTAFCDWVEDTLQSGDLSAMLDYRARAPGAERAHPTDEHFLPIYFALGAAGWGQSPQVLPQYISHEVVYSSLSMDAFSLA